MWGERWRDRSRSWIIFFLSLRLSDFFLSLFFKLEGKHLRQRIILFWISELSLSEHFIILGLFCSHTEALGSAGEGLRTAAPCSDGCPWRVLRKGLKSEGSGFHILGHTQMLSVITERRCAEVCLFVFFKAPSVGCVTSLLGCAVVHLGLLTLSSWNLECFFLEWSANLINVTSVSPCELFFKEIGGLKHRQEWYCPQWRACLLKTSWGPTSG